MDVSTETEPVATFGQLTSTAGVSTTPLEFVSLLAFLLPILSQTVASHSCMSLRRIVASYLSLN